MFRVFFLHTSHSALLKSNLLTKCMSSDFHPGFSLLPPFSLHCSPAAVGSRARGDSEAQLQKELGCLQCDGASSAQGTQCALPTTAGKGWHAARFLFQEHCCWGPGLRLRSLLAMEHLFSPDWQRTLLGRRRCPGLHSCNCPTCLLAWLWGSWPSPFPQPIHAFFLCSQCRPCWTPSSLAQRTHLLPPGNRYSFPVIYPLSVSLVRTSPEGMANFSLNVSLTHPHCVLQPGGVGHSVKKCFLNGEKASDSFH